MKFEEKLALFSDFAQSRGLEPSPGKVILDNTFDIEPDQIQHISCDNIQEFLNIINRTTTFEHFNFAPFFASKETGKFLMMGVNYRPHVVEVSVRSNDVDLVESAHSFIKENLGLKNPEVQAYDKERAKHLQPTIFIGRHFDKIADAYCNNLSQFLRLLGFDRDTIKRCGNS